MQTTRIGEVLDVRRRVAVVRCDGHDYTCSERAVHLDAGIEFYELREGMRVVIDLGGDGRCRILALAE